MSMLQAQPNQPPARPAGVSATGLPLSQALARPGGARPVPPMLAAALAAADMSPLHTGADLAPRLSGGHPRIAGRSRPEPRLLPADDRQRPPGRVGWARRSAQPLPRPARRAARNPDHPADAPSASPLPPASTQTAGPDLAQRRPRTSVAAAAREADRLAVQSVALLSLHRPLEPLIFGRRPHARMEGIALGRLRLSVELRLGDRPGRQDGPQVVGHRSDLWPGAQGSLAARPQSSSVWW